MDQKTLQELKTALEQYDYQNKALAIDKNQKIEPINLDNAITAYLQGQTLHWDVLYPSRSIKRLHIPGYHFDTKPFLFTDELPTNHQEKLL